MNHGTLRQIFQSASHVEWSLFEGIAALRCTAGVAIPLIVGLALRQPSVSAFGAVGAVSVGFGSFQGAYRSRAAVMVYASVAMALAIFVGSLAGASDGASIATATVAAFISGLLVALGPSAAFVGLQAGRRGARRRRLPGRISEAPPCARRSSSPAAWCRRCWS